MKCEKVEKKNGKSRVTECEELRGTEEERGACIWWGEGGAMLQSDERSGHRRRR